MINQKLNLSFLRKNLWLVFLLLIACQQVGDSIEGKVIGITDGDTIKILHNGKPVKIRLQGIDTPERKQAFGTKAKQFTSKLAFQKDVTVKVYGRDQYERILGEVILPDGKSLNKELVRNGFAWHYKKYSDDKELSMLEQEARSNKLGLWRDKSPVAPWNFRRRH